MRYCLSKFIYNEHQKTSLQTSGASHFELLTPLKDIASQNA